MVNQELVEYAKIITTQIYSTVSKQRLEDAIARGKPSREGGVRARATR